MRLNYENIEKIDVRILIKTLAFLCVFISGHKKRRSRLEPSGNVEEIPYGIILLPEYLRFITKQKLLRLQRLL